MDAELIKKTRINNRWLIAREGLPFIIPGIIVTVLFFSFGFVIAGTFFLLLSLFTVYFFRDPERGKTVQDDSLLSPADGRILLVRDLDSSNPLGEPAKKISIFMSVFNVHVNRAPADGKVLSIDYNPGRFLSANLDKASEENENNRITMETVSGKKIIFVQIAGLIARRIVCWVRINDHIKAGQRVGLIRFGSRLDVYIPASGEVTVKPGEKVKAGESVIGYLK